MKEKLSLIHYYEVTNIKFSSILWLSETNYFTLNYYQIADHLKVQMF